MITKGIEAEVARLGEKCAAVTGQLERFEGRFEASIRELDALVETVRGDVAKLDAEVQAMRPGTGEVMILGSRWRRPQTIVLGFLAGAVLVLGGHFVTDIITLDKRIRDLEGWRSAGPRVTSSEVAIVVRCVAERYQDRLTGADAGRDLSPLDPTLRRRTQECLDELLKLEEKLRSRGP